MTRAVERSAAWVELAVRTSYRDELLDITEQVRDAARELGLADGLAFVYVPHTTAGVTINEGADPAVRRDILEALGKIVPEDLPYRHDEGNSPAHVKASLMGASVLVPVVEGGLRLGRWQSIYLCEFDGPRPRTIWVGAGGSPSLAK
ncbi:MAG: secondary thiamine-phosphate synthase enzyme YjbQ [Gemmatimonadota bacterium]